MESNFSQPQRQSLIGVVVMFADTFQGAIRSLWPILVVWIFKIDEVSRLALWGGISAILIGICIIAYLKYLNFTFFLDEENEEFVVRKGIWNKSRIAIPLDKIQQVNINQSLIQKIVGVHALEVDTAGSSSKEVSIRAIKHDMALSLKERLLDNDRQTLIDGETTEKVHTTNHPFIQISLMSLFKTGITSNYVRSFALLLAFIFSTFQFIEDIINAAGYDDDPLDEYINPQILLRFLVFIIVGIMIVTLIINLVRTIVRYYNYKITKQKDSLLLAYGLINTKNTILRPNKVQVVTVGRNFFQKKFNINDLKIRQASGIEANDRDQKKTAIEIPGCSNEEKNVLLEFLLGSIPEKGISLKPSIRKVLMQTIGLVILPVTVYLSLAFSAFPSIQEYLLLLPIYIGLCSIVIYFGFRHYRLFVNDDFIIKQSGAWDIDKEFIAPHKIQTISIKQYFWHKSSNIGIVTLHTAGGTLSFGLADYTKLKQFVNYWLYQVETGTKHWM